MPKRYIPTLTEIGGLVAASDAQLAYHVRTVMRLLEPRAVSGYRKARFGRPFDGGYVHLDDFAEVDTAISLGINDDVSWDEAVAERGLTIHQFDHTVDDPAPNDHRMIFNKKMITAQPTPGAVTLSELVAQHDKRAARPNLILKMDVETGEWPVIEDTPQQALGRFAQITCEMHAFECLDRLEWRQGVYRALRKLRTDYDPIHVHGNNYSPFSVIAGVPVPNVLEVSWVNRAVYKTVPADELFPTELDMPCNRATADHYLGAFRY